jgi:type VI protein secretion system component VasK
MRQYLAGLTASAKPAPEFGEPYSTLKAYLITTSYPDKARQEESEFLTTELLDWWDRNKIAGNESRKLAYGLFNSYASTLRSNVKSAGIELPDSAVDAARRYLREWVDARYDRILSSVAAPSVNFDERTPGWLDARSRSGATGKAQSKLPEIPGRFTKLGWTSVQSALSAEGRGISAEEWVVRLQGVNSVQGLAAKYQKEFIEYWIQFMVSAQEIICESGRPVSAVRSLTSLSGPQSPLITLLSVVGQETDVGSPEVRIAFRPVRCFVQRDCEQPVQEDLTVQFLRVLFGLKDSLDEATRGPVQRDLHSVIAPQVREVRQVVHNIVTLTAPPTNTPPDQPVRRVHGQLDRLLSEPVVQVERCATGGGPCGQFTDVRTKYPLNARGSEAGEDEISRFFGPSDGALRSMLSAPVRPEFAAFLSSATRIRDAFFSQQGEPQTVFSVRVAPSPGIQAVKLMVEGREYTFTPPESEQSIIWRRGAVAVPTPRRSELNVVLAGGISAPGLKGTGAWSLFRLFDQLNSTNRSETSVALEWIIKERASNEPFRDSTGNPLKVTMEVSGHILGVLDRRRFAGIGCPAL